IEGDVDFGRAFRDVSDRERGGRALSSLKGAMLSLRNLLTGPDRIGEAHGQLALRHGDAGAYAKLRGRCGSKQDGSDAHGSLRFWGSAKCRAYTGTLHRASRALKVDGRW